jgi:cyanobactin maturation PatA/PatG family protease
VDFRASLTGFWSLQEATLGDPKVCVAVLDGPVDLSHPCFGGANIRRLNTLVQDVAGEGPMSLHGTHVASLIFGQPKSPVLGIVPRCRGLVAPVFRDEQEHFLSQLDLARAIEQAVQEGAHIINISGGEKSPGSAAEPVLHRALQLCEDNNVLVVAAVGNDACACLHIPAAVPSVLGVGALSTNGEPLETSNWGEQYKSNAILAPGENISGAAPGGGMASLSGSSFATPIVSGVAAALLSAQIHNGNTLDPLAVRRALLETAVSCQPRDSPECNRYLVGTLNIPGAYASVTKGANTVMTSMNTTEAQRPAVDGAGDGMGEPEISEAHIGLHGAASLQSSNDQDGVTVRASGDPQTASQSPQTVLSAPATDDAASIVAASQQSSYRAVAQDQNSDHITPSADCGCNGTPSSYVYAIGTIGFDFGTEARRDTFRQLMERPLVGEPPVSVPPNPYDVIQLASYLANNPSESTKVIWTLNLDATPIYAIEAETAYAEEVYGVLRSALRNQARPNTDQTYVSRVSIPGVLTAKTRRLFSGQVVPLVIAQSRGLSTWNEAALVDAVTAPVMEAEPSTDQGNLRLLLRNFLDVSYVKLRNLGQSPPDRALNYAATNAFTFGSGVALQQALLSAQRLPGPNNIYTLDTISVEKSPYCRPDSICYDVQVRFFDPENDRRARSVYQWTIDVSDEMPVSLAPTHQFFVAA